MLSTVLFSGSYTNEIGSIAIRMSNSIGVANIIGEKGDMKDPPMFDSSYVVNWLKRLKMWLMQKSAHLGNMCARYGNLVAYALDQKL